MIIINLSIFIFQLKDASISNCHQRQVMLIRRSAYRKVQTRPQQPPLVEIAPPTPPPPPPPQSIILTHFKLPERIQIFLNIILDLNWQQGNRSQQNERR